MEIECRRRRGIGRLDVEQQGDCAGSGGGVRRLTITPAASDADSAPDARIKTQEDNTGRTAFRPAPIPGSTAGPAEDQAHTGRARAWSTPRSPSRRSRRLTVARRQKAPSNAGHQERRGHARAGEDDDQLQVFRRAAVAITAATRPDARRWPRSSPSAISRSEAVGRRNRW